MRLLFQLVLRLVAVVALCLICAVGWVMVDAHRQIEDQTAATADRVARDLSTVYWREILWRGSMRKDLLMPSPEWQTVAVLKVVAPGVCVTFAPGNAPARTMCGQEEGVGRQAPDWFEKLYSVLFSPHQSVSRLLTFREREAGTITAFAVPAAALRQAWAQIVLMAGVAAAMAAAISLLAAMTIGQALAPARAIVSGLKRIGTGGQPARLQAAGALEFRDIAEAVNELSDRLAEAAAARAELTQRLFQVQEEERRALARDLHDEFGQCLTATAALAASIEQAAPADRADLAEDARAIARVQSRMMTTLKSALARLRSQEIEEIGLKASLEQLVSGWSRAGEGAARTRYSLDVEGEISALPEPVAIGVYRIAQECLTNAARHGRPSAVRLRVVGAADAVSLSVEDDGGGDPANVSARAGGGVLGIRERVRALGGDVEIGRPAGAAGVRVSARIPLAAAPPALPAAA